MKLKLITLSLVASIASSSGVIIFSESFENPTNSINPGGFSNTTHANWISNLSSDAVETWNGLTNVAAAGATGGPTNPFTYQASDGTHHIELAAGSAGWTARTFTANFTGTAQYTFDHGSRDHNFEQLRFVVAEVVNGLDTPSTFDGNLPGFDFDTTDDIELINNLHLTNGIPAGAPADWTTQSGSFPVTNGVDYVLYFSSTVNTGRGNLIDNVIVQQDPTTIPEPTSAALLGLGGMALLGRRKRKH